MMKEDPQSTKAEVATQAYLISLQFSLLFFAGIAFLTKGLRLSCLHQASFLGPFLPKAFVRLCLCILLVVTQATCQTFSLLYLLW